MTLAHMYAQALFKLQGQKPTKELAKNLQTALRRRGHEKLLPRIMAEYEKLQEGGERSAEYRTTTPEREQTRILLELYQKLVKHHG